MPAKPTPDPAHLFARLMWLGNRLDAMPRFHDPEAAPEANDALRCTYRAREEQLVIALQTRSFCPAKITRKHDVLRLSMMGLTVTCTHGLVGACHNWQSRAKALLATGEVKTDA